ncbi:tRNA (adenosine(37)-N6)-threonylcarbamoyltransferase complex ATPase subunit type 1 TsaE [Microgenomates group bacterium RIFCSPLOWO2_01_FULL_46_13]|nr:MAG: tRNA (adenosine(37)-N6)-threonylcarbamoyltransferase complex ATPase subunit type 1 TsaE [Microgenomates group bacterium RIFCSPHIGHO2_01_FULL_45_11]OGV94439.1 MAG: tRNA (adenosine(37)-N6)-threonylcarbamoyltransferase complex ATPase subunit type 1 TsaE [Microgenomates group bacterium RIFCSPLOWO2_01_FULL_46_13]
MKQIVATRTENETEALGRQLAGRIKPGTTVALYGELGSGKTVFTRGFARGLGIAKRIISPTFILLREYQLPQSKGRLYHLDLYRVRGTEDLRSIDLIELTKEKDSLVVVEWAEKAKKYLPRKRMEISFVMVPEGRKITVKSNEALLRYIR